MGLIEKTRQMARVLLSGASSQRGNVAVFSKQTCPECGSNLMRVARTPAARSEEEISADWRCPNPDCPVQIRERLRHWCSREVMNIEGTNDALIAQLVKNGLVQDMGDLYALGVGEVANLPNMTEQTTRTFLDGLAASKGRDLWCLVFGLRIPNVGADAAKLLSRNFTTLDRLQTATHAELSEMEGIGPVAASSLRQWFKDRLNRRLIEKLRDAGLNFHSGSQ